MKTEEEDLVPCPRCRGARWCYLCGGLLLDNKNFVVPKELAVLYRLRFMNIFPGPYEITQLRKEWELSLKR